MYTIFYNDSYIYDPYENQECVTDVKLTANVNAAAYLDFTISPKHPLYNIVEERSGIVKVYYDDEKLFEGVVDSIEMDMYGYKSISCVSALDYLGDTCTRSYHTGSVEPTDKSKGVKAPESIDQFFQWLIDQHNQHVQNSNKTFVVGVNQGSSFSESNIIDVESTSHESTADAITNNLIDRYGGYLTLTYEGEQRVLNLYSDVHEMNAQIMDFGVNITNFTKTTTTEDQYTAVYPIGGTPENKNENDKNKYPPIDISSLPDGTTEQDADIVKSGDVIFSRSAVARYGYKEYYYSENDILDATNLLKAAIIALRKSMSPKVSIDVKAIDCALFMKGYHHLAVGEAVRVRSNPHKVDEYLMVSSIDLDLQNPENTEYTLGTSYDTLTGQQSSYLRSLNSTINSAVDSVGALDKASKETAKTAQEAKANSIVAKDTANTAKDTADTAKNTADTAKDTADTAKNTANTAKDTADTAKNTADKAQTTAIAASNTAAEAKTTADSANNAAAELQKKTAEIDKQVEAASNAADAASAKADQVRTDLQKQVDANKEAADAASAKADQVRTDLTQQVQNVKSEMDSAVEAAQTSANEAQSAADAAQTAADKANATTVDLDKSIKAVDAKAIAAKQAAAEAQSKAENVASDLDSANAVIEQHSTELGELTTKVTNAVNESESALSVSTEAKQTATEASTTATSAYADAQTALTQSTTATQTATTAKTTAESASKTASDSLKQSSAAVQTANQISTTLRTEYQTKADADKLYATQSSLKQTSDSITASVSKTYATKDALSALQNVADNAIESWRGTGVPTLTNKPASDWTTNADKKKHSGDLYYDKSTGKAYRFGSDDGETYTWELNQDTDVTKALENAAKAQTSANNAQASATAANTAADNAQSTANTAVSNAATAKNAADAAQSSANKAQGDVDKLKIDIPETYATKSSLTQTAESITANVESVKATANSAVTAASNAQQTADSISANLTKNYQTKSQADTIYATQASLKATSDSISAEVTKAQGTADGAVTAASKAQQTADAVTLNLSKNYQTKAQNDGLYATQTSLKATSDSLSANITANANTAQSAVDKATSLEANLNGFKTTVAETYTTKNDVGVGNLIKNGDFSDGMTNWTTNGGTSKIVDGTYGKQFVFTQTGTNTNGSNRIYNDTHNHINGQSYEVSFYAKADKSSKWHFGPTGSSKAASTTLDTTLKQYHMQYQADNTTVFSVWTDNPTATIYLERVKLSIASGYYATNSSLTQTANSIKAEVSETYTTKNDFNNLTVGGTNRIILTGVKSGRIDMGGTVAVMSGEPDHCSTILVSAEPNTKYTISGSISTPEKSYVSVAFYDENGNFISRPTGAYRTEKESWKLTFTSPANAATMRSSFPVIFKGKIKLEKGNKPTDWSPAPEDLQPAGDYATNSSLTQTANSIKAQVTEVSNTANNAMSKATTVEQTANGLSTKITEQGKTLNATVTTANEAKSTADSNKTAISQTANLVDAALAGDNLITDGGFESTEWWKGLKAPFRLSNGSLYHGAHVLVCDAATGDNRCPLTHEKGNAGASTTITVTPGRTYRLSGYCAWYLSVPSNVNPSSEKLRLAKPDGSFIAEALCSKSTSWSETHVDWKCPDDGSITSVKIEVMHQTNGTILWDDVAFRDITEAAATSNRVSSVEQDLNGFKTTVAEVSNTANSALTKATTVEQTANGLQTTVTEQAKKLDDAVTTTSQVTQRVDSLSSTITQVQGDVNSLNASVRLINPSFETGDTTGWKFFGYQNEPYVNNVDPRSGTYKLVFPSINYDGNISLENDAKFPVKAGEVYRISLSVNPDRTIPSVSGTITLVSVGLKFSDDSTVDYNLQFSSGWHEYSGTVTIPSGKTEAHFRLGINIKAGNTVRVDSVLIENISDAKTATDTANSALSKSSSVEQNLNSFKTSVTEKYETKSDSLNKQSSLQQTVNNLRTEVSETYTTKNDFDNLTIGGTNLIRNSDFSNGTSNWIAGDGNSELKSVTDDVYGHHAEFSAVNGGRIYSLTSNVWENGQVYAYSFYAKASANGVRIQPSQSVWYFGSTHSLTTEWKHYTGTITCGTTSTGGSLSFSTRDSATYYITRVKLEKGTKSTDWSPAPEDMLSKNEAKTTYSTKSYVDQTAQSVALGVVQNYKGADGSGLATKSDITVTTESITSTVANTYATKSGVTQEISSKITQNNDSLDVKFATKTETQEAQNTANTANSNATNAQSRVGNIEDCITLTSNGVRAGKQSNGVFTGVSALVNSDGSFDLLDSNGELLTRVNRHTFRVTGDNGVGSGYITLSQSGINITVMPTDDPDEQYYIRIGSGGISVTSPDGAYMNCSATSGMILDTKEYGKLAIGPKGLQFTNDQGWGLQLGANGWSLNWAGNHKIATGPTGGKLYIDGHEIVTK